MPGLRQRKALGGSGLGLRVCDVLRFRVQGFRAFFRFRG